MVSPKTSIPLPDGWGLAQLTLHEQTVDNTGGVPFAGTVVVQLRFDAPPGTSLDDLLESDLKSFQQGFDQFQLIEKTDTSLEYKLRDPDHAQEIQQLVLYFTHGDDLYSLTATHRPASFDRVKKMAPSVLQAFQGGGS